MTTVTNLGTLPIGEIPRVVGTVTRFDALANIDRGVLGDCDIVEIRLDQFQADEHQLQHELRRLDQLNIPTLLTIRAREEGGAWTGSSSERMELFSRHLDHVSAIDAELASDNLAELTALAHCRNKAVIGSFHDFKSTPRIESMRELARRARLHKVDILKIAAYLANKDDHFVLLEMLRVTNDIPVCLIGMGEWGLSTRYYFPVHGSCLAYGYIDKPSAPGQPSCKRLTELLSETCPGFASDKSRRSI